MTWTDSDDVRDRWIGGPFVFETDTVTTLIADAEDTIVRAFPDIQDRIDNDELPVERVRRVTARMVIRHLNNPRGHRSTSQGAGPFQESVTYGGDEPGTLYLTDADRQELAGPTSLKGKAFSVDATPLAARSRVQYDEDVWRPVY